METNDKKRFVLVKEVSGKWKIKACQGHSVEVAIVQLIFFLSFLSFVNQDEMEKIVKCKFYVS